MLNAQPATGCIYKITCTKTDQNYIGRTMNVKERWPAHREHLRRGKHHSHKLQDAFWKYGESCLQYEVIETGIEAADLSNREAYWMKELKGYGDGFNIKYVGHPNGKPIVPRSIKPSPLPPAPLTVIDPPPTPEPNQKETNVLQEVRELIVELATKGRGWFDEAQRLRAENERLLRENGALRWRLGERFDSDEQAIA